MKKLVIGCGYLGRRVARAWVAEGHTVYSLTRSPEHAEQFRQEGIEPVIGDVTDPDSLGSLPGAETVLYAVGFDRRSGKSRRAIYVEGLENALRRIAPQAGCFLYISSTSVYGQSRGERIDEDSPCEPSTPNGQICLEAEQLVHRYFPQPPTAGNRGRAAILRLAGLYGPDRLLRRVEEIRSGLALSGNPQAYLNLIHVDDAVQAVLAAETHAGGGETCLVCDDAPLTRREYYELLAELTKAPPPVFSESGTDAPLNKRCRNRKLRTEWNVALRYPTIREGLPHALGIQER